VLSPCSTCRSHLDNHISILGLSDHPPPRLFTKDSHKDTHIHRK
jgi:hypothetical protein